MDPNAALARIRDLVEEAQSTVDYGDSTEILDDLADTISGLDRWLTDGGFLPTAWQAGA